MTFEMSTQRSGQTRFQIQSRRSKPSLECKRATSSGFEELQRQRQLQQLSYSCWRDHHGSPRGTFSIMKDISIAESYPNMLAAKKRSCSTRFLLSNLRKSLWRNYQWALVAICHRGNDDLVRKIGVLRHCSTTHKLNIVWMRADNQKSHLTQLRFIRIVNGRDTAF